MFSWFKKSPIRYCEDCKHFHCPDKESKRWAKCVRKDPQVARETYIEGDFCSIERKGIWPDCGSKGRHFEAKDA